MMQLPISFQDGISLTSQAIEKKAEKFERSYMKRAKKREGRRPKKETFILYAVYSSFKEKYPERKIPFSCRLSKENLSQYKIYETANLYRWMTDKPFKEMLWEEAWQDIRISYNISRRNAGKKEIDSRDIYRKAGISKKELEDLTGFILSQHAGNKKTSNKFSFDRPDK